MIDIAVPTLISVAVATPATKRSFVVVKPTTFAVPRTSRASLGMEVPIPTKPLALTIKLSSSTWTPLRKLNVFLILAISWYF